MIGGDATYKKITLTGPNDPLMKVLRKQGSHHGRIPLDQPHYIVEGASPTTHIPFSSANGGEYRKTYHGFAPSYAVKLDSPKQIQITPMQIDTWNRDEMKFNGSMRSKFVPGPLPRASQAPINASYSGLLECPMTTRLERVVDTTYFLSDDKCENEIINSEECFKAMNDILTNQGIGVTNQTGSDKTRPSGCSSSSSSSSSHEVQVFYNTFSESDVKCGGSSVVVGQMISDATNLTLELRIGVKNANITIIGPANIWYGVGFNATTMGDEPYTLVVDGNGDVTERRLSNHAPGTLLKPSVEVLSNHVDSNGLRSVVLSRPKNVENAFNFTSNSMTLNVILAVGSSSEFSYHKLRSPGKISLLSTQASCVCSNPPPAFGKATGSLNYHAVKSQSVDVGSGSVAFQANKCRDWPYSQLLEFENPTCDVRTYRGGQWACHHMWSLLDSDQDIPWPDQPLVFHHKYRFWIQPFDEEYHTALTLGEVAGSALLIGSPWELDVPRCNMSIAGCSYEEDQGWIHTIRGNVIGVRTFAALNFHCHAPTCLSMEVWMCDQDTDLKDCNETVGKLLCREKPIHGNPSAGEDKFNEFGYIAIPDCFWGTDEFGLESPINVTGMPLHIIKRSNATYGHYGEMAGGQPWVL